MESNRPKIRHCVAITALMCGLLGTVTDAGQQPRYRNRGSVCIRLALNDPLAAPAFRAMQDEASRIWRRHGITLTWTRPTESCGMTVPVVFDDSEFRRRGGARRDAALGLTVFLGRAHTVYISQPRARDMVAKLRHLTPNMADSGERSARVGVLLGRVVAHELGHVLLTTVSHSESGLMRPEFGWRDVLVTDDSMTDLSPEQTTLLARRFALLTFSAST